MGREVDKLVLSDGGDGSTFIRIYFSDGETKVENPDLPYDGSVTIYTDERAPDIDYDYQV